jgi:RNA polymerase sigma-70 factor (ECF subfamily)
MTSSRPQPDRELLERCSRGDSDAFGAFYVRYRERVLAYFARRVAVPELAADLMAETFARALVALQQRSAATPGSPVAWLLTIARNQLVDSLRQGSVESAARRRLGLDPLVLDDHDIDRIIEISEAVDLLEHAQACLSRDEWQALQARVVDEEPYRDIAERLRCSEEVVRKRVSRATAHLRSAIGGSGA